MNPLFSTPQIPGLMVQNTTVKLKLFSLFVALLVSSACYSNSIVLRAQNIGGGQKQIDVDRTFTGLVTGATYELEFEVLFVNKPIAISGGSVSATINSTGPQSYSFVASATSFTLNFFHQSNGVPARIELDNLALSHIEDLTFSTCEPISDADYRFAFNGMEKDDEVKKGKGNHYSFGARCYDSRLGRWLSIDPVPHVHLSPYNAFDNNPIYFKDPDGRDGVPQTTYQTYYLEGKNKLFPTEGAGLGFGVPFSSSPGAQRVYNKDFFTQESIDLGAENGANRYKTIITVKDGVSPSKAILDIFDNPSAYEFDCAETGQIMHLYALIQTMGKDENGDWIADKYLKQDGAAFRISQFDTPGVFTSYYMSKATGQTWSVFDAKGNFLFDKLNVSPQDLLNSGSIGTKFAIQNADAQDGTSFQNENFYKVGNDEFAANPMGGGLSFNEIKLKLAEYTYDENHLEGETRQEYADRVISLVEMEVYIEYEKPAENDTDDE